MSPSLLYRIAAVLLALFGLAHQLGFRSVDPRWGVDSALGAIKAARFQVQGMTRTYWDFFSGFGFFVTVFLLFAAVLAFQLGGLPKETLQTLGLVRWAFALSFVAITVLTWRYFFIPPLVLSGLAAICLVLAAWSAGRETPSPKLSAAPNLVALSATEYAFQAPDTVPAGWTTFRLANRGQEIHYGHMVRLDPGKTVPELVAAYAEAIRTSGPRPKWVTRFGGPGGAFPGDSSSVTQYLEPGSYVWICPVEDNSGTPHFSKGEFKSFVVRASDGAAADRAAGPTASVVIRLMDFSFALDSIPAGRHTIRVENAGVEPHDLVMFRLAPGKTSADLVAALNPERARRADQAGEPPLPFPSLGTGVGGIAAIAPGMESFFEADLSPGDYLLVCMATAPDGRSHIEHGMVREFRIH